MLRTPFVLAALIALAACGQRTEPAQAPAPAQSDVNAGSTMSESTSDTPTGQADSAEPETGTNIGRPDGPKDLKPGTDGNSPAAR